MARVILILTLFISCKFNVSPYTANVPKLELNSVNLKTIKQNESLNPTSFKIAFISDTHNHYKELKKIIEYINNNGPYDFVIVNGDTTIIGLLEEFLESKKYYDQIRFPVLVGIGNHDLLSNGGLIYSKIYGPTDFSFTYKNANFVFYNNNNWESTGIVPNTPWIKSVLNSGNPNILIGHVPPHDRERFIEATINDWETLTTQYPIPYIFAGHNHNPVVENFGSSILITIGSPPKKTLFEIIYNGGAISHNEINI